MPEKLESFNKWFEQFDFDGSRKDDLYDREWKSASANLNESERYIENYKSFLINEGYQENDIHKDYELMISNLKKINSAKTKNHHRYSKISSILILNVR